MPTSQPASAITHCETIIRRVRSNYHHRRPNTSRPTRAHYNANAQDKDRCRRRRGPSPRLSTYPFPLPNSPPPLSTPSHLSFTFLRTVPTCPLLKACFQPSVSAREQRQSSLPLSQYPDSGYASALPERQRQLRAVIFSLMARDTNLVCVWKGTERKTCRPSCWSCYTHVRR
jgi:hypothetical protein